MGCGVRWIYIFGVDIFLSLFSSSFSFFRYVSMCVVVALLSMGVDERWKMVDLLIIRSTGRIRGLMDCLTDCLTIDRLSA